MGKDGSIQTDNKNQCIRDCENCECEMKKKSLGLCMLIKNLSPNEIYYTKCILQGFKDDKTAM